MIKMIVRLSTDFRRSGFTVIELLIAMVLGMLLMAGVFSFYLTYSDSSRKLNLLGQQNENGRYAFHLLKQELAHSGFYGLYSPKADKVNIPTSSPDPCDISRSALLESIYFPVTSYTSATGNPVKCTLDGYKLGTDVLVIRHAATCISDSNNSEACTDSDNYTNCPCDVHLNIKEKVPPEIKGFWYVESEPTLFEPFCIGDTNPPCFQCLGGALPCMPYKSTAKDIRRYYMNIYYIRNWAVDYNEIPKIPTLVRKPLGRISGVPALASAVPLIEGVDDLQVEYGIDTNKDGLTDQYTDSPPSDWSKVVAVQLTIVTIAIDTNNQSDFPPKEFREVVRLTNVAGRLETK